MKAYRVNRRSLLLGMALAPAVIRRRARRADDAAPVVVAAERSEIRQRPGLLRFSRQTVGGARPGRSDRRAVFSRQPARPGNRRRQFRQARRHRSDGHRHLDLGQCRAADRPARPGLSLRELPAADQGARRGRGQAAGAALQTGANVQIIGWAYNFGSRSVLCKSPVNAPADLAGKRIRTLPNKIITECLRLMGAAATPLAFGEIYTALQAGVLDGLEHDPPTIARQQVLRDRQILFADPAQFLRARRVLQRRSR